MNTIQIAQQMVELNRQGKHLEALDSLFADDMVSIEAFSMPGGPARELSGRAAVRAKGEWWISNHEVHAANVSGPWPHGDRFIVCYDYDVTSKLSGQRMQMVEAALYTVRGGKIVREEFFYDMGG